MRIRIIHFLFLSFFTSLSIHVRAQNIQDLLESIKNEQIRLDAYDGVLDEKTAHPTANLFLNAKLLELLSLIFAPKEEINYQLCPFLKDNRNVEIIKKAKTILVQNLSENITIEKLSRAVGMNEHNLKLGFKEIYGSTVHQFINNYKLIEAKNQLLSGNYRIQEIAENFGYKNTSHFIGSFKKKFGQTPKQYLIKS